MIVYAESSAVLAWLLGEPGADQIRETLASAERVVSSAMTGVECARGLSRARASGRISPTEELAALQLLDVAETTWDVHDLSAHVLARARLRFPVEPVRTLDALHLATTAVFQEDLRQLTVVSLDGRVRANAVAMGLDVAPARGGETG